MFGNLSTMDLGSYEGYLDNLTIDLGYFIEHSSNLVMKLDNLDYLVVEVDNFVGRSKDFVN